MNIVHALYGKGQSKRFDKFKPKDFFPQWDPETERYEVKQQTSEEIIQIFKNIGAYNRARKEKEDIGKHRKPSIKLPDRKEMKK